MNRKDSIFTSVPSKKPTRNRYDLSHEVKTSGKFTYLYPMLLQETVPGDQFNDTTTIFLRFAPLLAPIMHRVDVITHFFFVPTRLLGGQMWESFITGGMDGTEAPVLPYITPEGIAANGPAGGAVNFASGTLWDHFGLPVHNGAAPAAWSQEQISAYPFLAYTKIFNDWYRDPNFTVEVQLSEGTEGDMSALADEGWMILRRKSWRKDYFTSALAQPQRGAQVLMPLSGSGNVSFSDFMTLLKPDDTLPTAGGLVVAPVTGYMQNAANEQLHIADGVATANITTSGVTINDFRVALATQSWLEANARGGYRYIDQIESHFAVRVPDYRLQRAEFLGGGRQPVRISETLSNMQQDGVFNGDLGSMAGHGVSVGKTNHFSYRCQEHGFIIGIFTVIPQSNYQQGMDRLWTRKSKFDFPWPELAHLGEQSILSKEIFYSFALADHADNQTTFGYTPRYAEYKFKNDVTSGDMRTTLDYWGLTRIFTARPVLDAEFTTTDENGDNSDEESMRRIFADQSGADYLWIQMFHKMSATRPFPYFGVPRLVG